MSVCSVLLLCLLQNFTGQTLLEVNIHVQNCHGVLLRLIPCMKQACRVLHGYFGPVYLYQVSKYK